MVGVVGLAMLTTYMIEPTSFASRSFTTSNVLPQRSTSSFSKCGSGERADDLRRVRFGDVEDGDAAPAADVRVVILEVHPGGRAGDVRDQVHVARGRQRWLDDGVTTGHGDSRRHEEQYEDDLQPPARVRHTAYKRVPGEADFEPRARPRYASGQQPSTSRRRRSGVG